MKMNCKGCGIEIDYEKEREPRAIVVSTGEKHDCPKFKGKKFNFTKKEYKDQSGNLEILAIQSEIEALKQLVQKHDDVIRAHTQQLDFQKGTEVEQVE